MQIVIHKSSKVKAMQRAAKQSTTSMDIRSDFTPFKSKEEKEVKEEELPAKLRIFLPTTGNDAEESDFDFSFNHLGMAGGTRLGNAVRGSTTLRSLRLHSNTGGGWRVARAVLDGAATSRLGLLQGWCVYIFCVVPRF